MPASLFNYSILPHRRTRDAVDHTHPGITSQFQAAAGSASFDPTFTGYREPIRLQHLCLGLLQFLPSLEVAELQLQSALEPQT
jgi:hypothetical protein